MKKIGLVVAVMAAGLLSAAGETAYAALQAIKNVRGDAVLNQLVEARGESGAPQPQSWTIVMDDATARGGIREFVVSGGQILSERTPVRGLVGRDKLPPINFTRLNLDSDGAFLVAEKEAKRAGVGFDSLDYTLRTDGQSGAPLWDVQLFDYMGAPVGALRVSAETGQLAQSLRIDPDARVAGAGASSAAPTPAPVRQQPTGSTVVTPVPTPAAREPMGGVVGAVSRRAEAGVESARDVTLRTAGSVQRFLMGKDTISPGSNEETE